MKTKIYLVLVLLLVITATLHAEVPQLLNYQGKLMQANGSPVTDGTYSIQFAIYDVPTSGTALWSETNANVQVKSGLFSALLGNTNNFPANIFSGASRFLAIKVGANAEMLPRQQITSVGYAFKAAFADTVADGAITASKIANGAITSSKLANASILISQLSSGIAIPVGLISMWTGLPDNIPTGWALCDGTNGTPDLRNKFIVGAGDEYKVADIGGEDLVTLTTAQMPSHNHTLQTPEGIWNWGGDPVYGIDNGSLGFSGEYMHRNANPGSDTKGGDQPHENRPPFYALCFIMKLAY